MKDQKHTDTELEAIRQKRVEEILKEKEPAKVEANQTPVNLTQKNFDAFVQDKPIVVVDFWADWCGPCKMVAPILKDLAREYSGEVWVGKVNVDQNRQLAMKYGASSIPTFWAFKEGVPVHRFVGAQPRQAFESIFKQLIDLDMEKVREQRN